VLGAGSWGLVVQPVLGAGSWGSAMAVRDWAVLGVAGAIRAGCGHWTNKAVTIEIKGVGTRRAACGSAGLVWAMPGPWGWAARLTSPIRVSTEQSQ
jgi:hypothetical protein